MESFYFLIAAFFSEIIATIAGFGAATLLMPSPTHVYSGTGSGGIHRRLDWKENSV